MIVSLRYCTATAQSLTHTHARTQTDFNCSAKHYDIQNGESYLLTTSLAGSRLRSRGWSRRLLYL